MDFSAIRSRLADSGGRLSGAASASWPTRRRSGSTCTGSSPNRRPSGTTPRGVAVPEAHERAAPVVPGGGGGLGLDGGMAEYLLVPAARHLVPLPDGLSTRPRRAADRRGADAVPRGAPVARQAVPGSTAVVIGVGGLGHLGVQVLQATTAAHVIAVDPSDSALQLAKSWAPTSSLTPGPDPGGRDARRDRRARRRRGARLRRARTRPSPRPRPSRASSATSPSSASPAGPCRCRSSASPTR